MLKAVFWNAQEGRMRSAWRLLLQLVLMLAVGVGVLVALSAAFSNVADELLGGHHGALTKVLMVLPNLVPIALSVWMAGRWLDRRGFSDFGFHLNRAWLTDLAFGMALGACLMGAIFVTELSAGWIHVTGVLNSGGSPASFAMSLAASFFMFVAVGFQEELFSRGYQLTNMAEGLSGRLLGKRTAVVLATLASSAIFGAMHFFNPEASAVSTVNIMVAGVFLSAGYILTGELALPIGLHITWNFFQGSVFGFPVSGMVLPPSVVNIQQGGDPIVTGGAFGPEAGLIGLAAMVAGTIAIALWVKVRKGRLAVALKLR